MNFDYKTLIKFLLAVFLIAFILYNLKVDILIQTITEATIEWILLGWFLIFLSHLPVILKIRYVLNKFHKISIKKIFWYHFFGYLMGQITPGKVGYLTISYALKKDKVPVSLSSSILILAELVSFTIAMILGGICIIYLASIIGTTGIIYMILIFGWIFGVVITILLFMKYGTWKFSGLIKKLPKGIKILDFVNSLNRDFHDVKPYIPVVAVLTFLSWMISGIGWWAFGRALDVNLPIFVYILLNPFISSLTFIPITPSGLGVAEAGNVLTFSYLGIGAEKGFIFMLLDRSIVLLMSLMGLKVLLSKKFLVHKK